MDKNGKNDNYIYTKIGGNRKRIILKWKTIYVSVND